LLKYFLRRCLYAVFVLLGVATVVFFLTRLTGNPVAIMLPPDATQAQILSMTKSLGLDKPIYIQYAIYMRDLLRLDFGQSIRYNEPALRIILERLPATIKLASTALVISLLLGIPIGIISALKRDTLLDKGIMVFALFGQTMPSFWLGIMLILIFAVNLRWFPTGGMGDWKTIILPAITLGLSLMALVSRLLRSSLIEALGADYIRTARAKGLRQWKVVSKHALRNSLLPVVTVIGLEIGSLLGGSVVTETVFAWPGVGQMLVQAINNRDYPLVQAAIIFIAIAFVFINLIVDILYAFIDPRIEYD
jgi:peptide/nickel transport system permease protein